MERHVHDRPHALSLPYVSGSPLGSAVRFAAVCAIEDSKPEAPFAMFDAACDAYLHFLVAPLPSTSTLICTVTVTACTRWIDSAVRWDGDGNVRTTWLHVILMVTIALAARSGPANPAHMHASQHSSMVDEQTFIFALACYARSSFTL